MTRKDYVIVARALREARLWEESVGTTESVIGVELTATRIRLAFEAEYVNFDADRFSAAIFD